MDDLTLVSAVELYAFANTLFVFAVIFMAFGA